MRGGVQGDGDEGILVTPDHKWWFTKATGGGSAALLIKVRYYSLTRPCLCIIFHIYPPLSLFNNVWKTNHHWVW